MAESGAVFISLGFTLLLLVFAWLLYSYYLPIIRYNSGVHQYRLGRLVIHAKDKGIAFVKEINKKHYSDSVKGIDQEFEKEVNEIDNRK